MNKSILIPLSIVGAVAASQTSALEFSGANIEFNYLTFLDGNTGSQEVINGSVEMSFGGAVGVQIDLSNTSYDFFENDGAFGGGAHVFYNVSPALTVGGFYFTEDWGNQWNSYGAEALVNVGNFTYDIAIGAYQESGGNANFFFDTEVAYKVNERVDITAGILIGYWGDFGDSNDLYNSYSIGAQYAFNNGLYIAADLGLLDDAGSTESSVNLAIGYNFGGGTTFGPRNYATLWPGD